MRDQGGDVQCTAWRLLDAQFWGVPQRRKRIYLVNDFGNGRAGQILFECESVLGYHSQGGAEKQGNQWVQMKAQGDAVFSLVSWAWL